MIKNDQQLQRARDKLAQVQRDLRVIDDPVERAPYAELAADLERNIAEYLEIRGGRKFDFALSSLDELPDALVKARLVRGMTQKELSEAIGVAPQQVQRDERGGYESAAMWRIADVLDALGFEFRAVIRPQGAAGVSHTWHADTWADRPRWHFEPKDQEAAWSGTYWPPDEVETDFHKPPLRVVPS